MNPFEKLIEDAKAVLAAKDAERQLFVRGADGDLKYRDDVTVDDIGMVEVNKLLAEESMRKSIALAEAAAKEAGQRERKVKTLADAVIAHDICRSCVELARELGGGK